MAGKEMFVVVVNNGRAGARFCDRLETAEFWRDRVRRNGHVAEIVTQDEFDILFGARNG